MRKLRKGHVHGGFPPRPKVRGGNGGGFPERAHGLFRPSLEGDAWYLVQSKYGTSFAGSATILEEGNKVIATLLGQNQHLSQDSQQLLQKLDVFRQQASDADRIVLVLATTDPISQQDRAVLDNVKIIGRARITPNFDVEEVSVVC